MLYKNGIERATYSKKHSFCGCGGCKQHREIPSQGVSLKWKIFNLYSNIKIQKKYTESKFFSQRGGGVFSFLGVFFLQLSLFIGEVVKGDTMSYRSG